jgi:outer membrane protein assembly factor BamB
MARTRSCLLFLALLSFAALARAADWPQWRGPDRSGISQEQGLAAKWPAAGPNLLWQITDLGAGYSAPAVAGDRLFVISNRGADDEFVQARAAADGKELWSTTLGKVGPNDGPQYPGSRSTPTVDGELLFALGSDGDLACLAAASGEVKWKKSLRSDFGGVPGKWAYSESPLVDGERLICTPGGAEATVVALDKRTGEVVWKAPLPEADQAAYASAIVVETAGVKQIVQFLEKGLVGLDAATGKPLWRYTKTAEGSPANIPTPVAADDYIYSAAGKSGGGLVKLAADGAGIGAEEVYFATNLPTAIGGSVRLGDYLYGANSQSLMCVELQTGEIKWQDRAIGAASLVAAEGRLYLHGENGEVALVAATPAGYQELGRFSPPNQPERPGRMQAWAYPAVAEGRLYFRDQGSLWCYDVSAAGAGP